MSDAPDRVPLPEGELYILREAALTPETCGEVLDFNRGYQRRDMSEGRLLPSRSKERRE